VLITDGANAQLVASLREAIAQEGAALEFVAPATGAIEANDGSWIEVGQNINGGPSVLYDAVVLLVSETGAKLLAKDGATRDFISDAYIHAKFIGYVPAAATLVDEAIGRDARDDGFIGLNPPADASSFVRTCRQLRFWEREERYKSLE
jgi:catalase